MKSGRYIGVMSGTSLDGVDVVLAAIDQHMVAQQASYCHPIPLALRQQVLAICQGQTLTLSQLGQLDTRLGQLFAEAVLTLMQQQALERQRYHGDWLSRPDGVARAAVGGTEYAANWRQ
ncbi:hypothetical protein E05_12840 [Plautia stali symbiont]|nr:hypothetical protein E05_12840 [Plautia stali symbiont]